MLLKEPEHILPPGPVSSGQDRRRLPVHPRPARTPVFLLAALVALTALAGCASTPLTVEQTLFAVPGARTILRANSPEERAAIAREAEFLAENYGFEPSGDLRILRNLRDLIDRTEIIEALHRDPALAFGRRLASIGHHFDPAEAVSLDIAAAGAAGTALSDPAVETFLARLRAEDLLHPLSGQDLIRLRANRAEALRRIASDPAGPDRVRSFAAALPYRFRPSDAATLLEEPPLDPESPEAALVRDLLAEFGVEARPGYLPELRLLVGRPGEADRWTALARAAGVRLAGPTAILALARVIRDGPPLDETERKRFGDLASRVTWPDAKDLFSLALLARAPGVPELVTNLAGRYGYRFDTRDAPGLVRLLREGWREPVLPAWISTDRVSLERPDLLLSAVPATAFAGLNDLEFMSALERERPDLARLGRDRIERDLVRRLSGRAHRFRLGAPYTETATEMHRFLRPDLLKAALVLDELDRPEMVAMFEGWLADDLADRTREMGGYARLRTGGRLAFSLFEGAAAEGRDDRLLLPPRPAEAALDFHFHATDDDDSAFAGPSSGGPGTDLFRAARHRLDGLVFTRLAGGRFNVDLYTSRETVLDLGVYGGPPAR